MKARYPKSYYVKFLNRSNESQAKVQSWEVPGVRFDVAVVNVYSFWVQRNGESAFEFRILSRLEMLRGAKKHKANCCAELHFDYAKSPCWEKLFEHYP